MAKQESDEIIRKAMDETVNMAVEACAKMVSMRIAIAPMSGEARAHLRACVDAMLTLRR